MPRFTCSIHHWPSLTITLNTMINAVLVFNNAGQPRLTKFYTQLETAVQQRLISEIFTLVANRPNSACNFLPYDHLLLCS
jgi:AP-3 complex subunit sigma